MQTLVAELITDFFHDAAALITGAGRLLLRPITAPIERIAKASDVAGVLAVRRPVAAARRRPVARRPSGKPRRRCRFSPFAALSELT